MEANRLRSLLTEDLSPGSLSAFLVRLRWFLLACLLVLPTIAWMLNWRLTYLWLLEGFALLTLLIDQGWRQWRRSTLLLPTLPFAALLVVSAYLSPNPITAWHGAWGRQEGALAWFGYLLLAVLPPLLILQWRWARRLLDVIVAVGSVEAAFVLLQSFDLLDYWNHMMMPDWYIHPHMATGHFTNSNVAGCYFALALVATILLYIYQRRPAHLLASGLIFTGLLVAESRGAWLSAAAALAVGLWLLRRNHGPGFRPWRPLGAVALFCLLCATLLLAGRPDLRARFASVGPDVVGAARLDDSGPKLPDGSSALSQNSALQRLYIWRDGLRAIAARPWFGWGPDNFAVARMAVVDATSKRVLGVDLIVDKAHNDLLQVGVNSGLVSLAAYLVLLVVAARRAWRGVAVPGSEGAERAAIAAGALGYYLSIQMTVTFVAAAPTFWLCLGLLAIPWAAPQQVTSLQPAGDDL